MWHAQNGEAMNLDSDINPNIVFDQSEFESERSDISTGISYIFFSFILLAGSVCLCTVGHVESIS
jgi:hypothetical protein